MTSIRSSVATDLDLFAGNLVLPDNEADHPLAGTRRQAGTLWVTTWRYDDLAWVAMHGHQGPDLAPVVHEVITATGAQWPDDLVLDLTDLTIDDVDIDRLRVQLRAAADPTTAVHLIHPADPEATSTNAVCGPIMAAPWTPARAYCGGAHHLTWRVPADLLPRAVYISEGGTGGAYHLVRHPRTGSAARDHRGNHVYIAATGDFRPSRPRVLSLPSVGTGGVEL